MSYCQSKNWAIVCFYRWHEQRNGVRVLQTRILVHSTFTDELWLWCFWTNDFKNCSVPSIHMESQRRDKPLGKLVGKVMRTGRETEGREKVDGLLCYQTPAVRASACKKWHCSLVDVKAKQLLFQNSSFCTLAETKKPSGGSLSVCLCSNLSVHWKSEKPLRRKTQNNFLRPLQHLPQVADFPRNNWRALQSLKSRVQERCRTTYLKGFIDIQQLSWASEHICGIKIYILLENHYILQCRGILLPPGFPSPAIKGAIYYFVRDKEQESH